MPVNTSLYLDTRNKKKNPSQTEFPLKIGITKAHKIAYLGTGIYLKEEQWKESKVIKRPDKTTLNDYLLSLHSKCREIIYRNTMSGAFEGMDAVQIKNCLARQIKGDTAGSDNPTFMNIYDRFAESRKSKRTKEIYRTTAAKLRNLYTNIDRLPISAITLEWLETFDSKLQKKGNGPSTRSIDLRNIKAVIKDAIRHEVIQKDPFTFYKIPQSETSDRSLTIAQLRTFARASIEPWEQKYRDFFFLSFFLVGINTEDLIHLKKIEDGRINYVRAKTGQPLSIKLEPEAKEIFERYRGKKYLLNILDTYSNTHNWTARVDINLKGIAARHNLPPITMYWARHSWATIAHAELGADLATIADALGHKQERKITMTYIHRRDLTKVDETNRKIINLLMGN